MAVGIGGAGAWPLYGCCGPATSVTIVFPDDIGKYITFGPGSPGQVSVNCQGYALPSCRNGAIAWHCEDIPDPTQEIWNLTPPTGWNVTLTLQALPSENSSFGDVWLSATADTAMAGINLKVFFTEVATNHPGDGAGTIPNWFFYWKQTSAKSANYVSPNYDGTLVSLGQTRYEGGQWKAFIGPGAHTGSQIPDGPDRGLNFRGIDLFAYECRHEGRHVESYTQWYPNGYDPALDQDPWPDGRTGDQLPDAQEPALGGTWEAPLNGGPFIPGIPDTDLDGWMDGEDYTCWTQERWSVGHANDEDWANPGKQSH